MTEYSSQQFQEGIEALQWAQAEKFADELQAGYTEGRIAMENHCSKYTVRRYAVTALQFPPEQRAQDLPFKVHVVCANSKDPAAWLDWVVFHQASEKEVRTAVRQAEGRTAQDDRREGEAIVQHFQRWAEHAAPDLVLEMAGNIQRSLSRTVRETKPLVEVDLPWHL